MSIDDEALARLRSLLANMTPGRWTVTDDVMVVTDDQPIHRSQVAAFVEPDDAQLIAAAVNALPALLHGAEAVQWQPIETAPRDGTAILVCYAPQYDTNGFLPVAVRWRNYHPNAQGKEAFRQSNGNKVEVVTHWMPLPKPPVVVPCTGGGE